MIIKAIILLLLAAVIVALGMSLYYLIRDRGRGTRTVKALIWRLVLTIALIILLLVAVYTGLLHPANSDGFRNISARPVHPARMVRYG